ncbi:gluconokinase [Simiduia agarivorans]|uniref:Gluconokinase n=1 Tax=Simiduia agarivorans (strain DSM 21679 / JCM 13881 / BCRC 17597 / SA1) TaxID=1117647 RepID=K4KII7_SIMAS|nr:gluconokinase [Simiduia agarivorans]AFU98015.1 gluconokinase [Simiduia agarivorans SA1 = DSM 21679]
MGVSGCGKSTLGAALAAHWRVPFYEGDDYHPPTNIERMQRGQPLEDCHRLPWLHNLREIIQKHLDQKSSAVISCSGLKRIYRELLGRESNLWYLWLDLPQPLLSTRLQNRHGHFMPASLLHSQLATLEAPTPDEQFLQLDASQPTPLMLARIDQLLKPVGSPL